MNQLYEKVGKIEGLLVSLDHKLTEFIERDLIAHSDLEKRVRVLENEKSRLLGIASVLSALVGFAVSWAKDWFTR